MYIRILITLGLANLVGCLQTYEPPPPGVLEERGPPRTGVQESAEAPAVRPLQPSSEATIYLDSEDASRLVDRIAEEGPPEQASRLHSCMKVKFDTLGRLLASRGANMKTAAGASILPVTAATNCAALGTSTNALVRAAVAQPARFVYCDSRGSLGLPQYAARLSEPMVQTTASATKAHDLFLAAAAEIIAGFSSAPECRWQNQQAQLFDNQNRCDRTGMACLLGFVPGPDLLSLCDQIVQTAKATPDRPATAAMGDTPAIPAVPGADALTTGKRIAVAAMLATAHMCE